VRRQVLVKLAAITALLAIAITGTYVAYAQVIAEHADEWLWHAWGGGLEVKVYGGWFAGSHIVIEVHVWNRAPVDLQATLVVELLKYDASGKTWSTVATWEEDITVPSGEDRWYLFGPYEITEEGYYKVRASL